MKLGTFTLKNSMRVFNSCYMEKKPTPAFCLSENRKSNNRNTNKNNKVKISKFPDPVEP